jgi:hypothetical protein
MACGRRPTPPGAFCCDEVVDEQPDLASVLRHRRRLTPAEVVTLVAPLALDLAAIHAAGRLHGAISPECVGFGPDGRPGLRHPSCDNSEAAATAAALGRAQVMSPEVARGGPAGRPTDVFGIAALGYWALAGRPPWAAADADRAQVRAAAGARPALGELAPEAPAALVAALEAGLTDDVATRCDASQLAAAVLRSGPAVPLRLHSEVPVLHSHAGTSTPDGDREGAGPPPRRLTVVAGAAVLLAVVAVVAVLAVVVGALTQVHRPGKARPSTVAQVARNGSAAPAVDAVSPPVWPAVLSTLDRARLAAVTGRDIDKLGEVYAKDSPLAARDVDLIRELGRRRLTVRGQLATLMMTSAPTSAAVASATTDVVIVSAFELPASYTIVDEHGRTFRAVAGGRAHRVLVRLRHTAEGWRIVDVLLVAAHIRDH